MPRSPALVSALPPHHALAARRMALCEGGPRADQPVIHDHSGIALYLAGTTRLWMGLDYTLTRGDLVLIPEGMPHCTRDATRGELIGVMLCTACMRAPWSEPLRDALQAVRDGGGAARRLDENATAAVEALAAALEDELAHPRPGRDLMLDGLMSQLVAWIVRAAPRAADPDGAEAPCPPLVADALAYIERHAPRAISLADVARAVHRSPAHLAAQMKLHTGRTVVEWITHSRMALARQLLLSSEEGVESIAARLGFASPSHFHRTFRRLHQLSPGAWRAAHRGAQTLDL